MRCSSSSLLPTLSCSCLSVISASFNHSSISVRYIRLCNTSRFLGLQPMKVAVSYKQWLASTSSITVYTHSFWYIQPHADKFHRNVKPPFFNVSLNLHVVNPTSEFLQYMWSRTVLDKQFQYVILRILMWNLCLMGKLCHPPIWILLGEHFFLQIILQ